MPHTVFAIGLGGGSVGIWVDQTPVASVTTNLGVRADGVSCLPPLGSSAAIGLWQRPAEAEEELEVSKYLRDGHWVIAGGLLSPRLVFHENGSDVGFVPLNNHSRAQYDLDPSTGLVKMGAYRIHLFPEATAFAEAKLGERIARVCTLLFEEVLPRDIVYRRPAMQLIKKL